MSITFRDRLKDILKDSTIYGISKILGQLISFFLIPLYTSYLSPDDYGILSIIGITSTSIALFMTFGLDSSTYRYVGMEKDPEIQKEYINSAQFLSLIAISIILIISFLFINPINTFFVEQNSPLKYTVIGILIAVFSSISNIPRAFLRINRKVKDIAIASFINIIFSILSTIILVVSLKMGILGALLGNLIGAFFSSLYLMLKVPNFFSFKISKIKIKELVLYSLPTLPAQLFAFLIPLYTQWSIKEYISLKELGLYAVALKFTIPLTVIQTMFQQAYAPYKYEIFKTDKNPEHTFIRIMNVYVLFMGTLFLMVSFFGGDILKLMTNRSFHSAYPLVFYLALIPIAQGIYFMMNTGLEFNKNPIYRPLITFTGLLVLYLLNNYLIVMYGIVGVSIAVAVSWLVMALLSFLYAKKFYKINYNWTLFFGYFILVIATSYLLNKDNIYNLTIKSILTLIIISFIYKFVIIKYKILNLKQLKNKIFNKSV